MTIQEAREKLDEAIHRLTSGVDRHFSPNAVGAASRSNMSCT